MNLLGVQRTCCCSLPAGDWSPAVRGLGFSTHVNTYGRATEMRLAGELDVASAPRLKTCVDDIVNAKPDLLSMNLKDLSFVDVAGLRALLEAGEIVTGAGIEYELRRVNDHTLRIIGMLGFDNLERACRPAVSQ